MRFKKEINKDHYPYESRIPPGRPTQLEGTLDWGDLKRHGPNFMSRWQGPHHFSHPTWHLHLQENPEASKRR
ncbi:hypothetical protein Hanom_Chr09g00771161 [Helianthus anomalus]